MLLRLPRHRCVSSMFAQDGVDIFIFYDTNIKMASLYRDCVQALPASWKWDYAKDTSFRQSDLATCFLSGSKCIYFIFCVYLLPIFELFFLLFTEKYFL